MVPFETFLLLLKNDARFEDIRMADGLLEDADRSEETTISLLPLRRFSYVTSAVLSIPATTINHVPLEALTPLWTLPIDFVSLQIDHPSSAVLIWDSKGSGISMWWLDERSSKEAGNWDLLDSHCSGGLFFH